MARKTTSSSKSAAAVKTRVERDSMGEMSVPASALYGASTQRAVDNFPVSGRPVPCEVVHAFGLLKRACAETNVGLKKLDQTRARLIVRACQDIADGKYDEHFPIDIFQTGSGTSTNMNVNEVVANICCVAQKKPIGSRTHRNAVHPNDHVNMGQSSNDTFPTAMQVAGAMASNAALIPAMKKLATELKKKARKFDKVVKIGRTHLMDATPIRLGQEFSGYAAQAQYCVARAERAMKRLAENLPIGGTAVGTGINTHREFGKRVCAALSKATKVKFNEASNHFEAQATRDCVVEASGELKTIAVALSKIANDIRWLGSGPRCGLFELSLPAIQPGSSIMPGKVNPVICESVVQVACQVVANDTAISLGGFGGVGSLLELNVAMPMMADNLLTSIRILANVSTIFVDKLLADLEVNKAIATGMVEKSLMLCTKFAPVIGYDNAAKMAKTAFAEGLTIREYATKHKLVDPKMLDELLDGYSQTEPE
ncbi:MAG: class II fumarate hydratase [Planctomycetes bacterium]|nr:class II fumarate hydratase [Planctomycetota bacterium]NOG54050.1 class II fumarate hydratase [Planctomycetota bacterium]